MNAKGDKEGRQNPEHVTPITVLMRRQRLLCPPSNFESLVFMVKCERLSVAPSFPANKQNVSDYFTPVERIKTKHRQAASLNFFLPQFILKQEIYSSLGCVRLHSWKFLSYCAGEFPHRIQS